MTEVELINKLNSAATGSQELPGYNAYIAKVEDMIGVAIPVEKDLIINEKFNKVYISNYLFSIDGVATKVIFLYTRESKMSEKYASICLNFIHPNSREMLLNNPVDWYNEWRDLLGDSKKKKMIFDFIGEMAVLYELQKGGEKPVWNSIEKGTFDITTDKSIYEVKTSTIKVMDSITIHNQFQLDIQGLNKPLYIAYVKVEANDAGESIDSLANKLISAGFDSSTLNDYLDANGYYQGKTERYKQFVIHEIRIYEVNENFPFITKDSFIDKKLPNNVIKLEYTISLDGLDYTTL